MQIKSMCFRYGTFLFGLIFAALGVSMITYPGMGSSPVSCLSLVLSFIFPLSLGTFVFLLNAIMFAGEILLYGKRFKPIQWLQLPATLVFSVLIDVFTAWLQLIALPNYPARFIMLLSGCVVLGIGVALEVIPDVIILPGEGIVNAISIKLHKEFGVVKTIFDISMVTGAALLSIAAMGELHGVREGTVIAALIVGSFVRFFRARMTPFLEKLYQDAPQTIASKAAQ